jgi:hypothetical protein
VEARIARAVMEIVLVYIFSDYCGIDLFVCVFWRVKEV